MKNQLSCLVVISIWIFSSCNKSNDGYDFEWPVSTPSAEGMNQQKLDSACIKADELGFVDALLVFRNGHLVAEKYYNGYGVNTAHQIYSDTKSFMSAILTKVTGKSALEFAVENLTGPMGIEIIQWNHDPLGNNTGGYDIYMKPRDMAVLGYMYQNEGRINNTQIVLKEWVDASLTRTWAANSKKWGPLTDYNYGYLWWLGKMNGYDLFMALGLGGQFIINFPDLNMIVVTTANKDISWDNEQEIPILEIVSDFILEAVN